MPCYESHQYGWCADEPVAYRDNNGKEYCVFHAPNGEKGVSLDEFNERVFAKIATAQQDDGDCNLSGTIFEWDISFSKFDISNPLPSIDFSNTEFHGEANFFNAKLSGEANFCYAKFKGDAYSYNAKFHGKVRFRYAEFSRKVSFREATFHGEVDFFRAKFEGYVYFEGKMFDRGGSFEKLQIEKRIRFEGTDLTKVFFLDTDLRRIDFTNCKWQEKSGRDVLYDEIILFERNHFPRATEKIERIKILYQRLKQKYKEEHNEPEVSNWHYGEKEMYRKSSLGRKFFPLSFSNLYWFSSGYGERPVRAGIVLITLIVAISLLMKKLGFVPIEDGSAHELSGYGACFSYLLNTVQNAIFYKAPILKASNLFGEYVVFFTKTLIPIQAALFAFALRNTFRR